MIALPLYGYIIIIIVLTGAIWWRTRKTGSVSLYKRFFSDLAFSAAFVAILLAALDARLTSSAIHPRRVIAIDFSESCQVVSRPQLFDQVQGLLDKFPANDRLTLIAFAGETQEIISDANAKTAGTALRNFVFKPAAETTDIAGALEICSAVTEPACREIYLLSDFRETRSDALLAVSALSSRGYKIHTFNLAPQTVPDFSIDKLEVPSFATTEKTVPALVTLTSTVKGTATIIVETDRKETARKDIELSAGAAHSLSFNLPPLSPGLHEINARLETSAPNVRGNDSKTAATLVQTMETLLIKSGAPDNLPPDFKQIKPADIPAKAEDLRRYRSVILWDVPASELSTGAQIAIRDYVRLYQGGFFWIGGEKSFKLGGFEKTPLAEISPLDPEPKRRKPISVVVAVDRSGSMSENFGNVQPETPKMQWSRREFDNLLNELRKDDRFALLVFNAECNIAISPKAVSELTDKEKAAAHRFEPNGGTKVGPPLLKALELLQAEPKDREKFLLFLTDGGASPDEKFDISPFAQDIIKNKITFQCIGFPGTPEEAKWLNNIAKACGQDSAEILDPRNPARLVDIFKSASDPRPMMEVSTKPTEENFARIFPLWKSEPLNAPEKMNRAALRESAIRLLNIDDEPLLAAGFFGSGKSAALATNPDSWASVWKQSPAWNNLFNGLLDWLSSRNSKPMEIFNATNGNFILRLPSESQLPEDGVLELQLTSPTGKEMRIPAVREGLRTFGVQGVKLSPGAYRAELIQFSKEGNRSLAIAPYIYEPTSEMSALGGDIVKGEEVARRSGGFFAASLNSLASFTPSSTTGDSPLWQLLIILGILFFIIHLALKMAFAHGFLSGGLQTHPKK